MSIYTPPTLTVIRDRISAEFSARLVDPLQSLKGSLPYALTYAVAGLEYGLHQGLSWLADQLMPQTAGDYQLRRWADIVGIVPQVATVATSSQVRFTGTSGTVIPASTFLVRYDGWQYFTDDAVTIGGGGTVDATCTSVEAGADGNSDANLVLTLRSPISGAAATATALEAFVGGLDDETTDALRLRVLDALREPTSGGRASDYEQWVRGAVSNVDVVWTARPVTSDNVVYIGLLLAADGSDCIPDAGTVATAQAAVDAQRPITAYPAVFQPVATSVNLTIELTNDTNAQRDLVTAALHKYFRQQSSVRETDGTTTVLNSQIRTAISSVTDSYVLSSVAGGSATADVSLDLTHVAILGTITWL